MEELCAGLVLFRIMQGCAEQSPAELAELAQVKACLGPMTHKIDLTQPTKTTAEELTVCRQVIRWDGCARQT